MRKLLLAVALLAVIAAPASAAVQNIKVGGELKSFHVYRSGLDLGALSAGDENPQNFFASIAKVNVAADLSDNVGVVIQLINERQWGENSGSNEDTSIDLDLAYIELKEFLYSPLTVTVGRQNLQYGNSLIIGGPNDSSSGLGDAAFLGEKYGWDAIKAVLDYDPLTIDIFAAKQTQGSSTVAANLGTNDDVTLYGVNVNFELGDDFATVVEGYFFALDDQSVEGVGDDEAKQVYTPGFRVSTSPYEGLSVFGEVAWQYGDTGSGGTTDGGYSALAYWVGGSFALPILEEYSPILSASWLSTSGDNDSTDADTESWQTMYEDLHVGRIFNDLFSLSDLDVLEIALEVTPMEDLTVTGTYYGLWLNENNTSLTRTAPGVSGITYNTVSGQDEIGSEFDVDVVYAYTEDVSFGVSAGIFMPGDLFDSRNEDSAIQAISSVNVAF